MSLGFGVFDHDRHLEQRRQLFDLAFPEHRGTVTASEEHYRWKFRAAPARPPSYEYIATEAGRLLGYYAAIPYPYEIGGRRVTAGMVCDVMTHPDARGKGVFTELGRFALGELGATGLGFVTGYPIRPEVMGGHLRAGWEVAFELPMYLKPLRANAILASRRLGWLAPPVNIGIAAYSALLGPRPRSGEYICRHGPALELIDTPAFERFVPRWSASVPNRLAKGVEFYRWRLGAPGADYLAFVVQRGEEVVAAAVARDTVLNGIPSLALLDLMVPSGDERALPTLYRAIGAEASRRRLEAIVAMTSRHTARRYRLRRWGFLRSPFTFKLIIRSVSPDVDVASISHESDWQLMWIDSDDL